MWSGFSHVQSFRMLPQLGDEKCWAEHEWTKTSVPKDTLPGKKKEIPSVKTAERDSIVIRRLK